MIVQAFESFPTAGPSDDMARQHARGVGGERPAECVGRETGYLSGRAAVTQRRANVSIGPATSGRVAPDLPRLTEANAHRPSSDGCQVVERLGLGAQRIHRRSAQLDLATLTLRFLMEEKSEPARGHLDAVDTIELAQGVDPSTTLGQDQEARAISGAEVPRSPSDRFENVPDLAIRRRSPATSPRSPAGQAIPRADPFGDGSERTVHAIMWILVQEHHQLRPHQGHEVPDRRSPLCERPPRQSSTEGRRGIVDEHAAEERHVLQEIGTRHHPSGQPRCDQQHRPHLIPIDELPLPGSPLGSEPAHERRQQGVVWWRCARSLSRRAGPAARFPDCRRLDPWERELLRDRLVRRLGVVEPQITA